MCLYIYAIVYEIYLHFNFYIYKISNSLIYYGSFSRIEHT